MDGHADQSAAEIERTLPDRIADELISRIFVGELRPGEALPPERALAEQLGVDRTSLRAALRQLTRMKLLRPVRGSGVTVLDYREHAGVDFLGAVLEVPGLQLGGAFLLEALEHWDAIMPHITASAFARATPDTLRRMDAQLAAALSAIDAGAGPATVAAIDVALQDLIIELTGDLTLRLMANSTRALRHRLTELLHSLVDQRAYVQQQRDQLQRVLGRDQLTPAHVQAHGAALRAQHELLHAHLTQLPPNPSRSSRWQAPARAERRAAG